LFKNLYVLQIDDFADHNFGELGRFVPTEAAYIRAHLEYISDDWGPEPFFLDMVRYTLSRGTAEAFIRTHPSLPITERDWALSKLFQLLYVPLEVRFGLPGVPHVLDRDVQERIEQLLDRLEPSVLSRLDEFKYGAYYHDVRNRDLETVLLRLEEHFPQGRNQRQKKRGRGPLPDVNRHRAIAEIVRRYGDDWRQSENLIQICSELDHAGIPVSKFWLKWRPPAQTFKKAHRQRQHDVVKALDYSLKHAPRV
jgi:hypothetical protein